MPDSASGQTPRSSGAPRGERFYHSLPYGSESQFNPFSLIINGGLDELRTQNANRHVFKLHYDRAAKNVYESIIHPDRTIRDYGFGNWVRRQLLPLSTQSSGGGQWEPNYHLHLLAGGMTGVRMTEWYQQHGTPHPELSAAATVFTWHFLTEMIEHQNGNGRNADAMSDLLVFDPAAFLIWRIDGVQRLFSTHMEMTNWPGQPAIMLADGTLQNAHQTSMARLQLPWTENWRALMTFGGSFVFGASRRRGGADWISAGWGWDPAENPVIDPETGEKTVVLLPNYGIYYDRHGSLLASAVLRTHRSERLMVNVYPGVLHIGGWSPGFWGQLLSTGGVRVGITPRFGLGLGVH
jgi:hypothetical protein